MNNLGSSYIDNVTYIKFPGHRSIASGEEDFLSLLPYMGIEAMFVM